MAMTNNQTRKLVTLGILTALGTVLMILEIPYPFVGFLQLDLSDVVVLLVFMMYGWKEAALVGVLKAVVHLLTKGPVMGGIAIPIGQITAFLASMSYVLGLYVWDNKFKLNKVVSLVLTVITVTIVMTVLNYFFITPIWFGTWNFNDLRAWVSPQAFGVNANGNYLWTILMVYVPFNLLKGIVIALVYSVIVKAVEQYLTYQGNE